MEPMFQMIYPIIVPEDRKRSAIDHNTNRFWNRMAILGGIAVLAFFVLVLAA